MAGFYNPFSAKPDWGGGLQDLASQVMQMIMMNRMYKDKGGQGQGQLPPGAASAMGGAGAQGGKPMPMGQGQASMQPQPKPFPQRQGMPTGDVTGGQKQAPEAAILSMLPPELQRVLIAMLKDAKFPTPPTGQPGQPQRMG